MGTVARRYTGTLKNNFGIDMTTIYLVQELNDFRRVLRLVRNGKIASEYHRLVFRYYHEPILDFY